MTWILSFSTSCRALSTACDRVGVVVGLDVLDRPAHPLVVDLRQRGLDAVVGQLRVHGHEAGEPLVEAHLERLSGGRRHGRRRGRGRGAAADVSSEPQEARANRRRSRAASTRTTISGFLCMFSPPFSFREFRTLRLLDLHSRGTPTPHGRTSTGSLERRSLHTPPRLWTRHYVVAVPPAGSHVACVPPPFATRTASDALPTRSPVVDGDRQATPRKDPAISVLPGSCDRGLALCLACLESQTSHVLHRVAPSGVGRLIEQRCGGPDRRVGQPAEVVRLVAEELSGGLLPAPVQ